MFFITNYFFRLVIYLAVLVIFSPPVAAKTYIWNDYTKPFDKTTYSISFSSPVKIKVFLPKDLKSYLTIPLIIHGYTKFMGYGGNSAPYLLVNDQSIWKAMRFTAREIEEKPIRVMIKSKYLKEGENILHFKDDQTFNEYGLVITKLRFDLPGLKSKETLSPKVLSPGTKSSKKYDEDITPPTIFITSHDTTRGLNVVRKQKKVTLKGRVTDENGVVEVIVDNRDVYFDEDGNFTADVYLKIGTNQVNISAMDRFKNRSVKNIAIVREASPSLAAKHPVAIASGKYYALIIGNNNYKYLRKLETAKKDAQDVAKILKQKYGFDTKILLDALRDDIVSTINHYRRILTEHDSFLLYYAGHGEFDKRANKAYWLPVDARSDDDTNWILSDRITSNIRRISSNHIIVVADSCYSGTLTRRAATDLSTTDERPRYLKKMQAKNSRTLLASGGNEPVSDTGGKGNSVFARALLMGLEKIEQPVFTAEELYYQYIREMVAGSADQTPEYNVIRNSGHQGGDFVFRKMSE